MSGLILNRSFPSTRYQATAATQRLQAQEDELSSLQRENQRVVQLLTDYDSERGRVDARAKAIEEDRALLNKRCERNNQFAWRGTQLESVSPQAPLSAVHAAFYARRLENKERETIELHKEIANLKAQLKTQELERKVEMEKVRERE
eukprot:SAG11_NODE_1248_length_5396_cov_2.091372_5_plen_147_part_00